MPTSDLLEGWAGLTSLDGPHTPQPQPLCCQVVATATNKRQCFPEGLVVDSFVPTALEDEMEEMFNCSVVSTDSVTPWTVARQAPLSMGFSRQEHWSGLPCPPPGGISQIQGLNPRPLR